MNDNCNLQKSILKKSVCFCIFKCRNNLNETVNASFTFKVIVKLYFLYFKQQSKQQNLHTYTPTY